MRNPSTKFTRWLTAPPSRMGLESGGLGTYLDGTLSLSLLSDSVSSSEKGVFICYPRGPSGD